MERKNVGQRFPNNENRRSDNRSLDNNERGRADSRDKYANKSSDSSERKNYGSRSEDHPTRRSYQGNTDDRKPRSADRGEERQSGYKGNTPRDNYRPYDKKGKQGQGKGRFGRQKRLFTPREHPEGIRINRFIANSGICSRREADNLVENGDIAINGEVVTTVGTRIKPNDVVTYKGEVIKGEKLQYILFNKPKDCITTADDPEGRTTVMEYLRGCCKERISPVGRLDRNTTGLLLFTNDGHLAEKLMHPRNIVKKLYHVKLDKPVTKEDMKKISYGVKLEDGLIKADQIAYVGTVDDRTEVGIEIHSGKNRVIRRIFESLDYEVVKLDRVIFAGLTKKDLRRGKYRSLTTEEIHYLKML